MSKYKHLINQLEHIPISFDDDLEVVEDKLADVLSDIIAFVNKPKSFDIKDHYNYATDTQTVFKLFEYLFDGLIFDVNFTKYANDSYTCSLRFYKTDSGDDHGFGGVAFHPACAMLIALITWYTVESKQ